MLDALTLDQIRTFVTVAESGSFRAGAGKLARAQSGVSVSIANLEAQLGVALFDRSNHRPALTPEGKALLSNAQDILLRVDAMRARARGLGEGVELELSITADPLFPIHVLANAIAIVRSTYPSVTVRLVVSSLGGPLQALIDRQCTLAIIVDDDFRDPRVVLETLSLISQVAVVGANHPLAAQRDGRALEIPDLADHLQIVVSDPTRWSEGRDFGVISPQTCRVSSQDAKHALILAGVGWGRLPLWLIASDLKTGRLVRLATKSLGRNSEVGLESYLARRLDESLGPAGTRLVRVLTELIRTDSQ
jgi:DNA-binding transcriptional LysR family regulator